MSIMSSLEDIANIKVTKAGTNEEVIMQDFWKETPCVILFLRRFGCALCRIGAKDLSLIAPALEKAGVQLIGIGLEKLGLEEFQEGGFFKGELYIDEGKKNYAALKYHRYNALTILPTLVTNVARSTFSRAKQAGVGGNLKGDGFQTGGLLVVAKGGEKILFEFRQNNVAEHPTNEDIMKSLGLEATNIPSSTEAVTCDDTACSLPPKN